MFVTVSRELRLARRVVRGIRRFAELIGNAFVSRVSAFLREDEVLTPRVVALFQELVARMIEHARDRLVDAEKAHREALRQEKQIRQRRDEESIDLYQKLLKARKTFEAFGPGSSSLYLGLEPGFGAADVQVILRHAGEAVDVLSNPDSNLPGIEELNTETLSPAEHVAEIRPAMEALDATLDELEDRMRDTTLAQKVKSEALEFFHTTFVHGSRFNEALYVLAGETFLSKRLRPRVGRGSADQPVLDPTAPIDIGSDPTDDGSDSPPPSDGGSSEGESSDGADGPDAGEADPDPPDPPPDGAVGSTG